ncbi:MAG TPA: ComEA family DNA-binding protein [Acidimicrobiales bacterium]|nr:ComEA family DNA-binding protein [Acidimicrobiales bacterium]
MFGAPDDPAGPAATRLRGWWEELLDTTGVGTRAVVAGVALLGLLAGSLWWLTRQAPPPVEASLPLVESTVPAPTTTVAQPVVVHVAGAVVAPGVHRLPAGARVIDAIDASGGLAADADAGAVNLAAPLTDGVQVYVPRVGEASPSGAPGAVPAAGPGAAADGLVDLNTADVALLETLPGVGPATAAAIVDHRERHGPFTSVEGLLEVRGIGEAKLAALRDLVRV